MRALLCFINVLAFTKSCTAFVNPVIQRKLASLQSTDATDCQECVPSAPMSGTSVDSSELEEQRERNVKNVVAIEYCTGCNWLLRSAWMAQEVLQTFNKGEVSEVALRPQCSEPGGDFRILVNGNVCWDRRVDKGFPQPKELKQRIRNIVDPDRYLGHNDRNTS